MKKRTGEIKTLRGYSGFKEFIYDVYETVKAKGGEICVSNVNEIVFDKLQGHNREDYLSKMRELGRQGGLTFKILVREGDENHVASGYALYRYTKPDHFGSVPFYVYGTKLAIVLFGDEATVHIIDNREIANAQRKQFDLAWSAAKETN